MYRDRYDMECGPHACLPLRQRFWDDLILAKVQSGMSLYWQDFLSTATNDVGALSTSATLGRDWLSQMGNACATWAVLRL